MLPKHITLTFRAGLQVALWSLPTTATTEVMVVRRLQGDSRPCSPLPEWPFALGLMIYPTANV